MHVKKDDIYRVYRLNTDTIPYSLFIWDMIDFEARKMLRNVERIFSNPPILKSAITCRVENEDEIICEFETLHEINTFPEELTFYRLYLDLEGVELRIENEDKLTLIFQDLANLPLIEAFVTEQLGIPDVEQYLYCLDKPNIYFCYNYDGRFMEYRQNISDLGD